MNFPSTFNAGKENGDNLMLSNHSLKDNKGGIWEISTAGLNNEIIRHHITAGYVWTEAIDPGKGSMSTEFIKEKGSRFSNAFGLNLSGIPIDERGNVSLNSHIGFWKKIIKN